MTDDWTRRDFLARASTAGLATALGLDPVAHAGKQHTSPAAGPVARKLSFDDDWLFKRGDVSGAQEPGFVDHDWTSVYLPHDWSIAGPYSKDEPCGGPGGYVPTGIGWYRKQFTLPRGAPGRQVSLLFDGVYQRSEVWINGHSLGMRPYGYISFAYDLTPWLRPEGQKNAIAVRVDNSLQPNSRWYSGSGIYRHVWLITTGAVHMAQWGTVVRSSNITDSAAAVEVSTRVRNAGRAPAQCVLTTTVVDQNGVIQLQQSTPVKVDGGGEQVVQQNFSVARPKLWSPQEPHLYRAEQTLEQGGTLIDANPTPFGIREAHFHADQGFQLNGRRVKLNGVCLHGDGGAVGAAVPESIWQRRLTLLKEMGCNAIRCSHNPPAPEFLDLCDQMGLLVMAEAFDEWREGKFQTPKYGYHAFFDEWAERDLRDMIARDQNHPSIILWSAGNEVPDQLVPRGPETLRKLLAIFHQDDPTRMVTTACDHAYSEPDSASPEFLSLLDVVGYNYVDRWRDRREKYYSIDRHNYPERRMIGTESIALGGPRGVYNATRVWGQPYSNMRVAVEQLQRFIQTYDYVSGDFIWTGIDYLGEARWPAKSSSAGLMDTCGFPKDSYYLYQSLWSQKPVLHLSPHWNWAGQEGEIINVICYTNLDVVELFVNGKSFGVKGYDFPQTGMLGNYGKYADRSREVQTTGDLHLAWDVPYASGTLKAIGRRNGAVLQTVEVHTAGDPVGLRLSVDKPHIGTARSEVAHVTVEAVDSQGRAVPTAGHAVTFAVSGTGRMLGVDNGDPESHESFIANERRLFNGLALVLLQSSGKPGTMRLAASSPGLQSAQIEVTAG